jgi:hypothetical protein
LALSSARLAWSVALNINSGERKSWFDLTTAIPAALIAEVLQLARSLEFPNRSCKGFNRCLPKTRQAIENWRTLIIGGVYRGQVKAHPPKDCFL